MSTGKETVNRKYLIIDIEIKKNAPYLVASCMGDRMRVVGGERH